MCSSGRYSHERFVYQPTKEMKAAAKVYEADDANNDPPIDAKLFGTYFEYMHAAEAMLMSQILDNPTMAHNINADEQMLSRYLECGEVLEDVFRLGDAAKAKYLTWWPNIHSLNGFHLAGGMDDERKNNVPFPWRIRPVGKGWGNQMGRLGPSVVLRCHDHECTLSQSVFLPFHRIHTYHGHIFLKALDKGNVEVRLTRRIVSRKGAPDSVVARAELEWPGVHWTRYDFKLAVDPNSVEAGESLDFTIAANGGEIWIDRVMLFPDDEIDGFDPEILARIAEAKPPIIRWPGGNLASGYHFADGIGPIDRRPTRPNPAWKGICLNLFGIDEYMNLCRIVGAQPHITLNAGDGTPEEAAALVAYLNSPADSYWGKKRSENGHPDPYGVKVFEVGNELYGEWQIGHCGPDEYVLRYNAVRAAVLEADPDVQLISNGTEFDFLRYDLDWNHTLVRDCAGPMNCIALHALPFNGLDEAERVPAEDMWRGLQSIPPLWEKEKLPELLDYAKSVRKDGDLRIAITEWGILGRHNASVVYNADDAIWGGGFYHSVIRMHEHIFETNNSALLTLGGMFQIGRYGYTAPHWEITRRYQRLAGGVVLPVTAKGPSYDVEKGTFFTRGAKQVPYIDILCVLTNKRRFSIAILNRHQTKDIPVCLDIPFGSVISCERYRSDYERQLNTPLRPDAVGFKKHPFIQNENQISVDSPCRSIIWLEVEDNENK